MTFLEALNSGKKVRSQYWDEKHGHIDTTIFTDKIDGFIVNMMDKTSVQLTWKEMLGEWYEVQCSERKEEQK